MSRDDDEQEGAQGIAKEGFGVLNQVSPKTGETRLGVRDRDWTVPEAPTDGESDIPLAGYRSKSGLMLLVLLLMVGLGIWALEPFESEPPPTTNMVLPIPEKMGDADGAVEAPAPAPPPRAEVAIRSNPPGASIVLNGVFLPQPTPTRAMVAAGYPLDVSMALAGHLPLETRLPAGTETVDLTLQEGKGEDAALAMKLTLSDVLIDLEGKVVPPALEGPLTVPANRWFSVLLSKPGHENHRVVGRLEPGETKSVALPLPKIAGARTFGRLRFDLKPTGAHIVGISAKGEEKRLGTVGYKLLELNAKMGEAIHFRATADGHVPQSLVVQVSEPQTSVVLSLKPLPKTYGSLRVSGGSKWQVFLDNDELEPLPVTAKKLESGPHVITVVDPQTRARGKFEIKVEAETRKDLKLVLTNGIFVLEPPKK